MSKKAVLNFLDEADDIQEVKVETGRLKHLKAPEKDGRVYINFALFKSNGNIAIKKVTYFSASYFDETGKERFAKVLAPEDPKLFEKCVANLGTPLTRYITVVYELSGRLGKDKTFKMSDYAPIVMIIDNPKLAALKTLSDTSDLQNCDIWITSSNPTYNQMNFTAVGKARSIDSFFEDGEEDEALEECKDLWENGQKAVGTEYSEVALEDLFRKIKNSQDPDDDMDEDDDEEEDEAPARRRASRKKVEEDDDDDDFDVTEDDPVPDDDDEEEEEKPARRRRRSFDDEDDE